MTQAPLADRRTQRAAAIIQAGDIHESKPGVWRVRDQAGSGTWHYVTSSSCDCIDFQRTGLRCKHQLSLVLYQQAKGERCERCGAPTKSIQSYIGGHGYCGFIVCSADKFHPVRRVN